jgi:hypothetical protein
LAVVGLEDSLQILREGVPPVEAVLGQILRFLERVCLQPLTAAAVLAAVVERGKYPVATVVLAVVAQASMLISQMGQLHKVILVV